MKRLLYIFLIGLVTLAISLSVSHFFTPFLEMAGKSENIDTQISMMGEIWQFLLLGFVIGGVIFTIHPFRKDDRLFKLAGCSCIAGSCILVAVLGAAMIQSSFAFWFLYVFAQIGISLLYMGIAITLVELIKEMIFLVRDLLANPKTK